MNEYICDRCDEKFTAQIKVNDPYCPACGQDDCTHPAE